MGTILCYGVQPSLWWLLLLQNTGSRLTGFRSCSMWPQSLCLTSSLALWHVESSQPRDWTCVLCIGRLVFIFCTTREVPFLFLLSTFVSWDQSRFSYGLTHQTTEIKQFSVLLLMPHESYCLSLWEEVLPALCGHHSSFSVQHCPLWYSLSGTLPE